MFEFIEKLTFARFEVFGDFKILVAWPFFILTGFTDTSFCFQGASDNVGQVNAASLSLFFCAASVEMNILHSASIPVDFHDISTVGLIRWALLYIGTRLIIRTNLRV